MLDFFFLSMWFLGGMLILVLAKFSGFSVFKVTVAHLFIIKSLVMSYFGYPFLYYQFYGYRVRSGIVDKDIITISAVAALFAIIIPLFVLYLLNSIVRVNKPRYDVFYSKQTKRKLLDFSAFYWVVALSVVVVVLVVYLTKVPSIALFESFTGGDVRLSRSLMTNDFPGKYHWYSLFFHDISWLISLVFISKALMPSSIGLKLFSIVSVMVTAFALIMTSQKAPVAWFLLSLVFLYLLVKKEGRLGLGGSILALLLILMVLIPGYFYFMGLDSITSSLYSISSRALTGQLSVAYNYQLIFPDQVSYLLGASFPNPRSIFPFEHYRLTVEVMDIINPGLRVSGVVGSQPMMYWGEAYANFGWWGVPIVGFYVGTFIYILVFLLRGVRDPDIKAAMTIWVGVNIADFANSGFSWSLLPLTLCTGFLVVFIHQYLCYPNKK